MPAHVARGNIPQITPELTATVRDENCLPNTTTPAAAPPTARPLGARDQNSVGGKNLKPAMHEQVVQAVDGVDIAQHLPQLRQRPTVGGGNSRGLVVPERRAARAARLTAAANTPTISGSSTAGGGLIRTPGRTRRYGARSEQRPARAAPIHSELSSQQLLRLSEEVRHISCTRRRCARKAPARRN